MNEIIISKNQENTRRDFLLKCLVLSQVPFLPGCVFLLRLFLGRGMLRMFRRGMRSSGYKSLVTIGRGMSMAARIHRLSNSINSPQYSQIVDLQGRHIAKVNTDKNLVRCLDNNSNIIFATKIEDDHFLHYDYLGDYIGRSKQLHNDRTNHYDNYGSSVGYDLIFDKHNKIEHYDKKGKKLGTSKIQRKDAGSILYADKALEQSIDKLSNEKVFKCKPAKKEYDRFRSLQQRCDQGEFSSCDEKRFSYSKLQRILKNDCKSK